MEGQAKSKYETMWIYESMRGEKGFTLIEMLITFSIMLMLLSLITPFLHVIYRNTNSEFNKLEWSVFIQQAKMEIRETKAVKISNNNKMLTFVNAKGQTITYEMFQDKIRRRVNGTGNEILLQKIKEVTYTPKGNGFSIHIQTKENVFLRALISSFLNVEVTTT